MINLWIKRTVCVYIYIKPGKRKTFKCIADVLKGVSTNYLKKPSEIEPIRFQNLTFFSTFILFDFEIFWGVLRWGGKHWNSVRPSFWTEHCFPSWWEAEMYLTGQNSLSPLTKRGNNLYVSHSHRSVVNY